MSDAAGLDGEEGEGSPAPADPKQPEGTKSGSGAPTGGVGMPKVPFAVADMPAGKTPVSLLNECCGSVNCTANYELVAAEGASHEPIFAIRLTVLGAPIGQPFRTYAQAKSKKIAKHLAAKNVLRQIVHSGQYVEWRLPGYTQIEAEEYIDSLMPELNTDVSSASVDGVVAIAAHQPTNADNVVGKLNEMCLRKKLPAPFYDVVAETGEGADRVFQIKVSIAQAYELGEGRNKKQAKRQAAERMLEHVIQCPDVADKTEPDLEAKPDDVEEVGDGEFAEFSFTTDETIINNERSSRGNSQPQQQISSAVADDARRAQQADSTRQQQPTAAVSGNSTAANDAPPSDPPPVASAEERFAALQLDGLEPSEACEQLLNDLCMARENIQAKPQYHPLPNPDRNGNHQCLVSIASRPRTVSCGTGATETQARWAAAREVLVLYKAFNAIKQAARAKQQS